VLVIVLLAVILALAIAAVLDYLQVDEIQLPDLRGMQYTEAASLLRQRELVPVSYPDNVPGAPVEAVISQTPPPGAVVRRGRTVAIGVNRPPEASRAPILLGLTAEQALRTADAVNLPLNSVEYAFSDQPAGRVIRQQPEAGERVAADGGMSVVVSRGPEQRPREMPDLMGMQVEAARRRLESLGLRGVESVAVGVTFDSPGTVTSQEPAAGEMVTGSTPVVLGYNLSARQVVPVPPVVGQNATVAGRLLKAAGLSVGELRYVEEPEAAPGSVVEVSPSGHTLRGAPVVLTVNAAQGSLDELAGEAGEEPSASQREDVERSLTELDGEGERAEQASGSGRRILVSFDPATLGVRSLLERPYDLRLVVQDKEGERTVIDRRVRAGEKVSAVVVVEGEALLQTYINGVFFQAWRP
jgi:beta-lactam-binding protein with PASTA domain